MAVRYGGTVLYCKDSCCKKVHRARGAGPGNQPSDFLAYATGSVCCDFSPIGLFYQMTRSDVPGSAA